MMKIGTYINFKTFMHMQYVIIKPPERKAASRFYGFGF